MKKTFTFNNVEYTVSTCTAIAGCDGRDEANRQDALLVKTTLDSGEVDERVVFGYPMPEDDEDFAIMSGDYWAWDSDYEVLETVCCA